MIDRIVETVVAAAIVVLVFVAVVGFAACKVCTYELNGNMGGEGCEAPARDAGADGGGNG